MVKSNPLAITRSQLSKWHFHFRPKTLSSTVGISANENWNKAQGLPNPFLREILHHVWYDKNGILESDEITTDDIQQWIQNQTVELKRIASKHQVNLKNTIASLT